MQTQTYNQAILDVAEAGIQALQESAEKQKAKRTPAQESHFLCAWLVESFRVKRFSKLVADDLSAWIRMARSQGAGAMLPQLFERIAKQYRAVEKPELTQQQAIGQLLTELESDDWFVISDSAFSDDSGTKLKLAGNGQSSLVVCELQLESHFEDDKLVKSLPIYVRGDENHFAERALAKGLLVSQGNKKTSLIKHHKTYLIAPNNQLKQLCLLIK
ncbi:DUF2913 family protein [Shewanella sp. 1_MG-2023]|uniref:DUF2913 family protein n=1 Tax=unclassified Shewanella TaxID=196818 RepID=UPI000C848CA6|nr:MULTISPECIES: DUF2913 family protein [unclassified Shewanella]MDO6609935.1 DUF2913 family protein [Shewanella sp. 7_MG-2023]MDO6769923.1 DUF2913 family protein [Shewanella sp. 2_MG-2023]MDO6792987.1 DUF2913 family protein [Shewanella sp. 1_MG-2023]PMG71634.1 hypothetical protein BCU84_02800 [Shewanella sp. 10N.286.51.B7]